MSLICTVLSTKLFKPIDTNKTNYKTQEEKRLNWNFRRKKKVCFLSHTACILCHTHVSRFQQQNAIIPHEFRARYQQFKF